MGAAQLAKGSPKGTSGTGDVTAPVEEWGAAPDAAGPQPRASRSA
jgi:hypothetical protein